MTLSNINLPASSFINTSPIASAHITKDLTIKSINPAFSTLTKQHIAEGAALADYLNDEEQKQLLDCIKQLEQENTNTLPPFHLSLTLEEPNTTIVALTYVSLVTTADGPAIILQMVDQTEQKNLELRFSHSQKMQAVGQLAGGVAHDFNNLLTAIIGFCDLLLLRHPAGDPSFADIMQIKQNANRAANLVRQLLAFSRKQTLQPKALDITDVMAELANLIRRLIGEHIELNIIHGRELGQVMADQGQLEQVIINLAVNARDAMQSGGHLRIESSAVHIAEKGLPKKEMLSPADDDLIEPGNYILLEVQDTGTGIPKDIVKQIFEPFFSTKDVGSGTGLGLATVYGIIRQSGGYIYVTTAEGKGTTFSLYFKHHSAAQHKEEHPVEAAQLTDLSGGETILLVEDETPVRIFAARALRNKGYNVLEADCGEHAVEVFEDYNGTIDLIVSDVMMPGMNGPTMLQTLKERYTAKLESIKVIFISGYAEDVFGDNFGTKREFNFLAKPFTLKQLASKVKDVLQEQTSL